ncbi:hypothetical protein Pan216_08320 [Planctomycetes bacterium Pan216]|uniref:TOD1/MUCI70 glycosyltransferase-like domain-containing protein n=1 Tax=Kolteria novifilia TaxID=2527975 RepID=A0A518AZ39_9BACT|nr:hypothetical protein Pan216_08320 [Planctomycetes bacterium Pan216]
MRVAVLTAIYGDRDILREPRFRTPGWDYICFSDKSHLSKSWDVRVTPPHASDPCLAAKIFKVLPHRFVEADVTIWVDGNQEIMSDLYPLARFMSGGIGVWRHPKRHCLYAEAAVCVQARKDSRDRICHHIRRYREEGFPEGYGLWGCGHMVFRHGDITKDFCERWWREIIGGTRRDQVSFPYVVRHSGIKLHEFQGTPWNYLKLHPHAKGK